MVGNLAGMAKQVREAATAISSATVEIQAAATQQNDNAGRDHEGLNTGPGVDTSEQGKQRDMTEEKQPRKESPSNRTQPLGIKDLSIGQGGHQQDGPGAGFLFRGNDRGRHDRGDDLDRLHGFGRPRGCEVHSARGTGGMTEAPRRARRRPAQSSPPSRV